jgi:hypothetical protein
VNTKKLAGVAAVGAVSAVTTLLLGATPALAQEDSAADYAFALEASGALDINPISRVESADGTLVHDELLSIGDVAGEYEDDISVGLLTAEAESYRAETSVKEVNLLNLLRADVIRTWCDNGEGGLEVINGTILGQKIPDTAVPGEELDISPLLSLALNDQVRHSDGSLTVTGIELKVLPAADTNPDEELSAEEKAALPVLGDVLGKPLTDGANTVRDVVDQLGGGLGLGGDLQTITIGKASCQEGDAGGVSDSVGGDSDSNDGDSDSSDGDSNDSDSNDGDSNDDGGDDDGGNDDAAGDSDVKSAPAPSVVQAALPVTG